jgi:hypothetical protein
MRGNPLGDLGLPLSGTCAVARWETWVSSYRGYVGSASVVCLWPAGRLEAPAVGYMWGLYLLFVLLGWGEEEKEEEK